MSNNEEIINKLLDSAEKNVKNIHDDAISKIKNKYKNLKDDNKSNLQSKLNNIINYHETLLAELRKKYSPKKKPVEPVTPLAAVAKAAVAKVEKETKKIAENVKALEKQIKEIKNIPYLVKEIKEVKNIPSTVKALATELKKLKEIKAVPLTFAKLTKEEKKAITGPPGPPGEPLNGLMIDTDNVRVRTKGLNPLIVKKDNTLSILRGVDSKTDSQIILGQDLALKNNGNNVFLANGTEVMIGNGKKIKLNGQIDKVKATRIETDEIQLGDSKKILLTAENDNNYISSKDNSPEFHAGPNNGWKFIKNNKGRRTDVINIKNNGDSVPETTISSDLNINGRVNIEDISSNKYNLKDNKKNKLSKGKEMKGSIALNDGNVSIESNKGLELSDSESKIKFLGMKFDNNKGIFSLFNSVFNMNNIFKIKTDADMIHLQNKYDENIYEIPIIRDTKFKASDIKVSSTYPGAPMYNCLQGHTRTICSTNKKNGVREYVTLKLPVRKVIAHIDIYNRIDAFMEKIKDVEVFVTDKDGNETFRTKLTSISDYYHIPVNSFGTIITLQQTNPNKEINLRNIRVFTRNLMGSSSQASLPDIPVERPVIMRESKPLVVPTVKKPNLSNKLIQPKFMFINMPSTMKWSQAISYAKSKGYNLATTEQVQNHLKTVYGNRPAFQGDFWIPVADSPNDWLSIGTGHSDKVGKNHKTYYGPPTWGEDPTPRPWKKYMGVMTTK